MRFFLRSKPRIRSTRDANAWTENCGICDCHGWVKCTLARLGQTQKWACNNIHKLLTVFATTTLAAGYSVSLVPGNHLFSRVYVSLLQVDPFHVLEIFVYLSILIEIRCGSSLFSDPKCFCIWMHPRVPFWIWIFLLDLDIFTCSSTCTVLVDTPGKRRSHTTAERGNMKPNMCLISSTSRAYKVHADKSTLRAEIADFFHMSNCFQASLRRRCIESTK